MSCQPELHAIEPLERALQAVDSRGLETSLVEVVLLACDQSEDATTVDDLVEGVIRSGAARILPRDRDPMLAPRD